MPTALYRTYKEYAGFVVRGSVPVESPPLTDLHISWAFYVLSQMEAANYGTVQSYDGCGISAGPLHAIAVSPSTLKQGGLFRLIAQMFGVCPPGVPDVDVLRDFFTHNNMQVTLDGVLIHTATHLPVSGEDIRALLSHRDGHVPASGPEFEWAKTVALIFNRAFSAPQTFAAQKTFTIQWLLLGNREAEYAAYTKYSATKVDRVNVQHFLNYARQAELGAELDLAMCVYHAFTVNAPAPAADELSKALVETTPKGFARHLIRGLGLHDYGRWHDTTDNTSRYDRTRLICKASHRWDPALIDELMPENLT